MRQIVSLLAVLLLVSTGCKQVTEMKLPDAGVDEGVPDAGTTDAGPADAGCNDPCDCCAAGQVCNEKTNFTCCTPTRCEDRECGDDGCGTSCGTCQPNWTCNTGSGTCECTADTDEAFCTAHADARCGVVEANDNCGAARSVDCSFRCAEPKTCHGDGTCACDREDDSAFCARHQKCGADVTADDNCGVSRTVADCGGCGEGFHCEANACVCTPEAPAALCAARNATCGTLTTTDHCGAQRTVQCGLCGATETCNASNTCVCRPESETELCVNGEIQCGPFQVPDRCGTDRTIASCGTCGASEVCTPQGHCLLCTPETDAQFCSWRGAYCGSISDNDSCGVPRTVTCGSCNTPETCQPNNACGDSVSLTNDVCSQPALLALVPGPNGSLTSSVGGNNLIATDNVLSSCAPAGGLGKDLIYKFIVPPGVDMNAQVELTAPVGSNFQPDVSLRSTCWDAATELTCGTSSPTHPSAVLAARNLAPGEYIVIADSRYNFATGPFEMRVALSPVPATPANDSCATPQTLTLVNGAVTVFGDLSSAMNDSTGLCETMNGGDVVYTFTLGAASSVTAIVTPDVSAPALSPAVYIQSACASVNPADQIACAGPSGGLATATVGYLPAGTYYVIVDSTNATFGAFSLQLNATAPLAGETCANPMPLLIDPVTGLGTITGDTTNAFDDAASSCAASPTGRDLVYELHVPGTSAMRTEIEVIPSGTGLIPAVSLRTACGDAATEIACVKRTSSASTTLSVARLPPGIYYLWVDGAEPAANGPFAVNVTATAAPPPPPNDQCALPETLALNAGGFVTVTGTTVNAYDDSQGSCSNGSTSHAGGDVVYALTLPAAASKVAVSVTRGAASPTFRPAVYLRGTCDDSTTSKGCANETNGTASLNVANLTAGTYAIIVDGIAATEGDFTLTVAAFPAATNDNCGTALALDFDRNNDAFASNNTAGATSDAYSAINGPCRGVGGNGDLVYSFTLADAMSVHAEVAALGPALKPVVYVRKNSCTSQADADELNCNVAGAVGGAATINVKNLAAGTYWLIVDSAGNEGPFMLHVHLDSPPALAPNDLCAGAIALQFVNDVATVNGDLDAAMANYDGTCKSGGGFDLVYSFTLATTKGITFTVTPTTGDLKPVIYVNSACGGAAATEKGCTANATAGAATTLTIPALLAGTYYVVVDAYTMNDSGPFTMTAALNEPPPPPPNDVCAGAPLLTWTGTTATWLDDTSFANDDDRSYCSTGTTQLSGPDLVYRFELTAAAQVTAKVTRAAATPNYKPAVSIRSTCQPTAELVCARDNGSGISTASVSLDPGTYYVFVDGVGSATAGSAYGAFTLELTQAAAIPSDGCGNAQPIVIDPITGVGTVSGDTSLALSSTEDGLCATAAGPTDVVYSLTLAQEMAVQVTLANPPGATRFYPDVYMRRACADPASQVNCAASTNSNPASFTVRRLPAGTYFIWVDSTSTTSQGPFVLTVTTSLPSQAPAANDTCTAPQQLVIDGPNGGAQVVADTGWGLNDYAGNCSTAALPSNGPELVYTFTLSQAATVYASVARHPVAPTTFYPQLYLRTTCGDATSEVACTSAGSAGANISQALQAGTYYLFVDGLRGSSGMFVLNIATAPTTPLPNDTCATARALTFDANGLAVAAGNNQGLVNDSTGSCLTSSTAPDAVYSFTLTGTRRVTVDINPVAATAYPMVYVQTTCGQQSTERGCAVTNSSNAAAEVYLGSLAAGTYYVFADSYGPTYAGPFVLSVRADLPPPPPANDVCSGAQYIALNATTGRGTATGNTQDATDNYQSFCSSPATPLTGLDQVYWFTLPADGTVTAKVTRDLGNSVYKPAVSIRSSCAAVDELACARDVSGVATATATLTAGTYYVFVDGVSTTSPGSAYGPFTVDISTATAVSGDGCGNAIALNPDPVTGVATASGDLATATNSGDGSCQSGSGSDVIYSLTLSAAKTVKVTMTPRGSSTTYPNVHMRRACADPNGEIGCAAQTTPAPATFTAQRLNAGTYFIWADASNAGGQGQYILTVETSTPTVAAPANDTCATQQAIALDAVTTGVHLSGDTNGGANDYAGSCGSNSSGTYFLHTGGDVVYAVTLAQAGTLYAVVNKDPAELKTFNPAVYLRSVCDSAAASDEIACGAANSSQSASLSAALAAGTYYLIVDGQKGMVGKFLLDVVLRPAGAPSNDTCADAQAIALDANGVGVVAGTTVGMTNDASGSCASSGSAPDVVYSVTTTGTKNIFVDLMAGLNTYPVVYARAGCSDTGSVACDYKTTYGVPAHLELLNKPAGTYYLWVDGYSGIAGPFSMTVKAVDPPTTPANDTCAGAQSLTLPAPGAGTLTILGNTYGSANNYTGSCATATNVFDGPDNVYTFTTATQMMVSVKLRPLTGAFKPALYIRSVCDTAGTDRCVYSATAGQASQVGGAAVLPAGTWYLIVDGVGATMGDYALDLSTVDYAGVGSTFTSLMTFPATGSVVQGMATDATELFYQTVQGSTYSVGAIPKAGGTSYSKGAADGLGTEVLQYDIVEANGAIFTLDSGATNTTGRLWKIKDASGWLNPPVRWDVPSGVTTSSWPTTAMTALTFDGTDLIIVQPGTSATAPVAFFAVSAAAPELPRSIGAGTVAYNVKGVAADANYFYVAGSSTGFGYGVWRIERANLTAPPLKVVESTGFPSSGVTMVKLDSLTAPRYLYVRSYQPGSPIVVVDRPAGAAPVSLGGLLLPGIATQYDYGMTYDRASSTLYYFETITNSKGVIWKVQ